MGEDNFAGCSDQENPLYDFSIVDHGFVNSPDGFQALMNKHHPNKNDASLLFIHGFNNSFSEAAERLAQLAVDLNLSRLPVLFSWPSDVGRTDPCNFRSALSQSAYTEAAKLEVASHQYAAHVMDQFSLASRPFQVLAHSMGTDLAANAIVLKDKSTKQKSVERSISVIGPHTLVLAAPDISTKDFNANLRPKVIGPHRRVVVYCSDDRALLLSQRLNNSDERLGYCAAPKAAMGGVDLVSVKGDIKDFARHSYFLNSAKLLDDIRQMLAEQKPSPSVGGQREIRLP